jgi:hypothetical protein
MSVIFIAACGSRRSGKISVTPDQAFARLKPSSSNPLLCHLLSGYGCGRLSISTSSGEASVTHEDFIVDCNSSELGLSIAARDQAGLGPGLSFGVNVAGVTSLTAEKYVCSGIELTSDPVLVKWKEKSCGVFVRYGETESWTIADEPCTVTLETADDQWRGVIDCPRLSNGTQAWNFNDPAVFTCPKK